MAARSVFWCNLDADEEPRNALNTQNRQSSRSDAKKVAVCFSTRVGLDFEDGGTGLWGRVQSNSKRRIRGDERAEAPALWVMGRALAVRN